jgi:hypothetical protein
MLDAGAGIAGVGNFCLTGNKTPQEFDLLIINVFQILRTKKTLSHFG